MRKSFLPGLSTVGAFVLLFSGALPATAQFDSGFLGINNGTGFNTDTTYVNNSVNLTRNLGFGSARVGMDGVDGRQNGAAFSWTARDAIVNKYISAGIEIRSGLAPRAHVERGANYEVWKANYRYFCRNVMQRYNGKIFHYIIDNEPELDYGQGTMTAQQCVDMTRIAYEEARAVSSAIKIESPPTMSPYSDLLRQMIQLNIGSVCDFIGIHVYGGQINEGQLNRPWQWLSQYGTTRKPIVISESGVGTNGLPWTPDTATFTERQENRRRWLARFYVQAKRYGYSHVMFFSLTDGEGGWEFYDSGNNFAPVYNPLDADLKTWYRNIPLQNGGFESGNDPLHQWFFFQNQDNELGGTPTWAQVRTGQSTGARTGSGYLWLNTATTAWPTVKRVVGNLIPGKTYQVGGYAFIQGGGKAGLFVDGSQQLNGETSFGTETTTTGSWRLISFPFTPTNKSAVLTLYAEGTNVAGRFVKFDDVTVTASLTNTTYEAEATGNTVGGGGQRLVGRVGYLGVGGSVTVNNVNAGSTGTKAMTVQYTNGSGGNLVFSVSVNGGPVQNLSCRPTANWDTASQAFLNVRLNAGNNTIRFFNNDVGAPDLDKIVISQ